MITTLLTLMAVQALTSCENKDDLNSFITDDIAELNRKIEEGRSKKEHWTETPLLIINKFFGPEYNSEGHQTYLLEQHEKDNSLTITVTSEGLLDDSVEGEKRIIEFTYTNDKWTIVKLRLGFKCYEYRGGHTNYSGTICP